MANKQPSVVDKNVNFQGRPNQIIAYESKTPDWYHSNAEYYIRNTWSMSTSTSHGETMLRQLYEVYNNKFPLGWFTHITNPLNSNNPLYQKFPAKIRPINILRTSIDLIRNELSQRPFVKQVANQGEGAFNEYNEALQARIVENLTQHFAAQVQQMAQGEPGVEPMPEQPQEIPIPAVVQERFVATYKDNQAIRGQRWLDKTLEDVRYLRKRSLQFLDFLVSGWALSFKAIIDGKMFYDRVSPLELKWAKSPNEVFVNKAAWAVRRYWLTTADAVERFHGSLSEDSVKEIYARTGKGSNIAFTGQVFYDYLRSNINDQRDLVPIFHCVWRGKKAVKILTYPDPTTGMMEEMEVDEAYPVDKEMGESSRTEWRDEVYECSRILENIYAEEGPCLVQNGNLPYNGRAFSDVHTENISILQIGLPFQLMVMIINWSIERTIAKSKGKILLLDINTIPSQGNWDEEKFFYYAEAMGYGLLDRSNLKVDRTMNQYHVLDMSLYDQIKQLIDLQNHFRQMWDDVLGITMPRKGQTYASSSPTNNERSLFQSNIITDNIFTTFEELQHEDFNDMLDYSKILTSDGVQSMFTSDLMDNALLDLDPVEYIGAMLGIVVRTSAKEQRKLDEMKMYMQELIQNGVKPSTLMEIILSENVAELRTKLKEIERIQAMSEQQMAQSQEEAAAMADERKMAFAEFQNGLDLQLQEAEWNRRDQNEMIKGEYNIVSFQGNADPNANGVPEGTEIADRVMERFKTLSDQRTVAMQEDAKMKMHKDKVQIEREKMATTLEKEKIKGQYALKNKTSGEK